MLLLLLFLQTQERLFNQISLIKELAGQTVEYFEEHNIRVALFDRIKQDGEVTGIAQFLVDLLLYEIGNRKVGTKILLTESDPRYRTKVQAVIKGKLSFDGETKVFTVHYRITSKEGKPLKSISGQFRLTESEEYRLGYISDPEL